MLKSICLLAALVSVARAQPSFPTLTLPWGTWQASKYDDDGKFYTFKNVRFGRATNGTMRFKASSYPDPVEDPHEIQDHTYGPACPQIDIKLPCLNGEPVGAPNTAPVDDGVESEDCLFLDLYVPGSAFENNDNIANLPVIVWFFGGAFLFGSKNVAGTLFYDGTGVLRAAAANEDEVIYVAGNYRVGAFGWLAGSSMEENATPNAGLHDQRLLLEWVRDYIHLVGGNASSVSAWGESAGAGSILHHLIQDEGERDPLFQKAVFQSPAFQWQWNRKGTLDDTYQAFAELAECDDHSIDCLQNADFSVLQQANALLFQTTRPCTGLFPVGPAVDGKLIKQLPAVAFHEGKYWKNLESVIVSHMADESGLFIPQNLNTIDGFDDFLDDLFPEPELAPLRAATKKQYPAYRGLIPADQRKRAGALIRDSVFTCTTRVLYDAYHDKIDTYMMQNYFLAAHNLAFHGADLFPLYWNSDVNVAKVIKSVYNMPTVVAGLTAEIFTAYAPKFQAYLASYAVHGNPNTGRVPETPEWKVATNDSDKLHNVLRTLYRPPTIYPKRPALFFDPTSTDMINTHSRCDFWTQAALEIAKLVGAEEAEDSLVMQRLDGSRHPELRKRD